MNPARLFARRGYTSNAMPLTSAMFASPPSKSRATPAAGVTDGSRASLNPSIVHLGVGGFFRSHMAVYCEDLIHDSKQRDQVVCLTAPRDRLPSDFHWTRDSCACIDITGMGHRRSRSHGR